MESVRPSAPQLYPELYPKLYDDDDDDDEMDETIPLTPHEHQCGLSKKVQDLFCVFAIVVVGAIMMAVIALQENAIKSCEGSLTTLHIDFNQSNTTIYHQQEIIIKDAGVIKHLQDDVKEANMTI